MGRQREEEGEERLPEEEGVSGLGGDKGGAGKPKLGRGVVRARARWGDGREGVLTEVEASCSACTVLPSHSCPPPAPPALPGGQHCEGRPRASAGGPGTKIPARAPGGQGEDPTPPWPPSGPSWRRSALGFGGSHEPLLGSVCCPGD